MDLRESTHLAVVQFTLDQVGLNATLRQGVGCAGAGRAAADDCNPKRPVQLRAVADSKHLREATRIRYTKSEYWRIFVRAQPRMVAAIRCLVIGAKMCEEGSQQNR